MPSRTKKRRSREFWQLALDRAQLGVWDWDLETDLCFYSATWARMLGYREDELSNASDLWLQFTHPDDREQAIASGERHLAGLTDHIETELRLKHRDGHWIWVLDRGGVVERDADGKPLRMIGVQTDITRQKETEYQLAQVNARFRLALAATGTGIWHYDIDGKKSFWDERTRNIFGYVSGSSEVPSDLWHSFLHPDDKEEAERAHWEPVGSDRVVSSSYRIIRRDGEVRHVESLIRFIADPQSSGQVLGTVRDVTDEHRRDRELAYAARHDALTGLLNRAAYYEALSAAIATADRHPLSIFYVDLDYFKALNDFAGHAAGDIALKSIASGIRDVLPLSARVARLGGDEFALFIPDCATEQAERHADEILATIRKADLGTAAPARKLSASIGIAFIQDPNTLVADALACADDACYAAKATGRNRFMVFSTDAAMSTTGLNAARIASETVDAMEQGRMHLFGQEIRRLDHAWETSRIVEVLVRLEGRNGELITPANFIPAAERFGVASKLDRWVIETALHRFGATMAAGDGMTLCFNLSAQTLSDPHLWDFVDSVIEQTGAPHSRLVFEITETTAVTNFEAAEQFVQNARARRCRVSLDDFGAGMSSFEYLRRFPIDSIKINGSFVEHMADNKFDREIVSAINGLAKGLGYSVVAEKIEHQPALDMLRDMGVQYGQGFLLHRPEPLEALIARSQPGRIDSIEASRGRSPAASRA